MKKYRVTLTAEERQQLQSLIAAGKAAAKALAHARILLKADEAEGGPAWPDRRIAEAGAEDRRPGRGPAGRPGLLGPAERPEGVDPAAPGRPAGGAGGRRIRRA